MGREKKNGLSGGPEFCGKNFHPVFNTVITHGISLIWYQKLPKTVEKRVSIPKVHVTAANI